MVLLHTVIMKISKFKMLYFQNEIRYGVESLYKGLFFKPLQPGMHKNSENSDFRIEFNNVMVNALYQLPRHSDQSTSLPMQCACSCYYAIK